MAREVPLESHLGVRLERVITIVKFTVVHGTRRIVNHR